MAQKMEFLAEDLASVREATTEELQTWFDQNAQRFAQPPRATFRHLYFSPDRRGQNARSDATRALEQISAEAVGSPESLHVPELLWRPLAGAAQQGVRSEVRAALFQLAPGSWQGPIESGFGWHLIWVESITPERVPAFEEAEDDVKEAWTADWRDEVKRKAYATMRKQYEIVPPESNPNDVAAAPPTRSPVNEP